MTHDVVSVVPLASSRRVTVSVRRYPRLGGSGLDRSLLMHLLLPVSFLSLLLS